MTTLADRFRNASDERLVRALNQAARELLLMQSSDWAFQISRDTTAEYAASRFRRHVKQFNALADQIAHGHIDESQLAEIELRDNLFQAIDFRIYCAR